MLMLNPPVISGDRMALTWAGSEGVKLQKCVSLTQLQWEDVPGSEGKSAIELPQTATPLWFRLIKP